MSSILGHDVVLNHVALAATDMAASCAFYEVIGFVRSFEKSDADGTLILRQMRLGNFFLELFPMNPDGPKSVEGNHFGLRVASTSDACQRLVAAGIVPAQPPARGASGVSYMFVQDPSGNWIELTSA